jgi:AcrR family transcriptional regulator
MTAPTPPLRRDAARNHQRVLAAARDVLQESGADASIELIAARAGVGVGTVYRRFANKDALIDELLRLHTSELLAAADAAIERADGSGLEQLLRSVGRSFATHCRYAELMLERGAQDDANVRAFRTRLSELTKDAVAAGTVNPQVTLGDVLALIWSMRGLMQTAGGVAPDAWQRFLDIHLAGLRTPGSLSSAPALTARQLTQLAPQSRPRAASGR